MRVLLGKLGACRFRFKRAVRLIRGMCEVTGHLAGAINERSIWDRSILEQPVAGTHRFAIASATTAAAASPATATARSASVIAAFGASFATLGWPITAATIARLMATVALRHGVLVVAELLKLSGRLP